MTVEAKSRPPIHQRRWRMGAGSARGVAGIAQMRAGCGGKCQWEECEQKRVTKNTKCTPRALVLFLLRVLGVDLVFFVSRFRRRGEPRLYWAAARAFVL